MIDDRAIVIGDHAVVEHDTRRRVCQRMTGRWDIRLRQGDAVQFFTVRQLGDQRLLQQGRLLAGLAKGAVSQHAGELHKLRDLIEAVEHQHQGDAGAVQVG